MTGERDQREGGKHSIDGILGDTKSEDKSDVDDDDDGKCVIFIFYLLIFI